MSDNSKQPLANAPRHIAIIMDGNGRWAKARMLPRMAGHRAGTENLRQIIKACVEFGVKYLTIYAFSTENWKRPDDEVKGLMRIFAEVMQKEVPELHEQGVRIIHLGSKRELSPSLQKKLQNAEEMTKDNNTLVLSIALNYGGRDEILHAVREIIAQGIAPDQVNVELLNNYLYTAGIPDPDLVIRTSGELRTSNFLLWQSAYSEWLFTDTLWPDFDKEQLRQAILNFGKRNRRFGGRTQEDEKEKYNG